jgi:glucokinase
VPDHGTPQQYNHLYLIADIGGTNARFAACRYHPTQQTWHTEAVHHVAVKDYTTPEAAITALFSGANFAHVVLAVAGPVRYHPDTGATAKLTNAPWHFAQFDLERHLGAPVTLLNDFIANAYAIPTLHQNDILAHDHPLPDHSIPAPHGAQKTYLALGPGTGLGQAIVTCYARHGQWQWIPIATEAGHSRAVAATQTEADILATMQQNLRQKTYPDMDNQSDVFWGVRWEDVVSGQGIRNIFEALTAKTLSPEDIYQCSQGDSQSPDYQAACQAIQHFADFLAYFIQNAILSTGSWDGVFIFGGVFPRILAQLDYKQWRSRISQHKDFTAALTHTPIYCVTAADPAFKGLLSYLQDNIVPQNAAPV